MEDMEHPVTRMIAGLSRVNDKQDSIDHTDRSLTMCIRRVFSDTTNTGSFIELAYALWDEPGPQKEAVRAVMRLLYKLTMS